MSDRMSMKAAFRHHANRLRLWLLGHGRLLLLSLGVILVAEGLLEHVWLGHPLGHVLQNVVIMLPALLLLVVAAASVGAVALQLALLVLLFWVNYAQYTFWAFYGRLLGADELRLAAANSARELLASVSLYFSIPALSAALAMTTAYAVIVRRSRLAASHRRAAGCLVALLGWCLLVNTALPRQSIYSPVLAFATTSVRLGMEQVQEQRETRPSRREAPLPTRTAADFDVLYLIGESIRADRLRPHAYARNVAPHLHSLTLPHVTFNNVSSHGDCTGRSVPMLMVAPEPPLHVDLYRRPTLFAYARKAGFHTAFVNSNENDWHEFVDANIELLYRNIDAAGGEDHWTFRTDDDMLPIISRIANAPGRQFLVIETYTSHWPYGDRYEGCPACRVYRPDLVRKPVPFAEAYRTQITNSYDNAIVYFDQFVAKTLALLRKPTLVVLTSDHGESLGEEHRWGHCSAGIEQMLVPFMLIATDEDVARAAGFAVLAGKSEVPISHSNIFPTLLGIFGYDVGALGFRYARDLASLPAAGETDRQVLVSEIGSGLEPVSFGFVNASRAVARWASMEPPKE